MNLIEAVQSGRKFSRVEVYEEIQHFKKGTGPYPFLVDCDYFVVDGEFSTSIDLYADEILAEYRFLNEHL